MSKNTSNNLEIFQLFSLNTISFHIPLQIYDLLFSRNPIIIIFESY